MTTGADGDLVLLGKTERVCQQAAVRQGLFPSEGGFWLRQRRMVQHTLHRERIRAYGTTPR